MKLASSLACSQQNTQPKCLRKVTTTVWSSDQKGIVLGSPFTSKSWTPAIGLAVGSAVTAGEAAARTGAAATRRVPVARRGPRKRAAGTAAAAVSADAIVLALRKVRT